LHLKKLEIFGFKSFAEKTSIEFSNGVSAIVGPNGSGKSNIVDALRWVLGEQGDKALRSEKREDVIFNGTRSRKPLSVAEVSLSIVNDKNILPTEYSEVQIARRFYRNGETEYYLNGVKVRLKDIKSLFADTGIGPDAYSVIELKMTEIILSSVKNERRKLFEEAAGIVSYKHNRDLTINKLNSVKDTLLRVNDIIREKQRNVNALERQVKRNEEAKLVSEELKQLELLVFNYDYASLKREINNINENEKESLELKDKLEIEINENKIIVEKKRINSEELENKLDSLTIEREKIRNELELKERENIKIESEIKSNDLNKVRLLSEIDSSKNSISNNEKKQKEKAGKTEILKEALNISESSLREKREKVEGLRMIINENKIKVQDITSKLKEINKTISNKKEDLNKTSLKLENNFERLSSVSKENENIITELKDLETEKFGLDELINNLSKEINVIEKKLNEAEKSKNAFEKEIELNRQSLTDLQTEYNKTKTKADYFAGLAETLEDFSDGIRYLTKDIKAKNAGTILDIIEVDDKYKVAIETALGEVSNYLVLENAKDVNRYINLLVNNKKGKVTFILNDKINYDNFYYLEYYGDPEFIKDKGIIGFADKFVNVKDKKYESLINYILDEYIIVENLDTGLKYSKDNYYKFITLDGDIITDSVIRAGSETNVESIRLGRENNVNQLNENLVKINSEIKLLNDQIETAKNSIDILKIEDILNELKEKVNQKEKIKIDLSKLNFKIDEFGKQITRNETLYKELTSENKKLQDKTNLIILELNKDSELHKEFEEEAYKLTDIVNNIQNEFSHATTEFNEYNLKVMESKKEYEYENENLTRISSAIQFHKNSLEKNISLLEQTESKITENQNFFKVNTEEILILKKQFEASDEEYRKMKSEFDKIRAELNSLESLQYEKVNSADKINKYLFNSQLKLSENNLKCENLNQIIKKKYEIDLPLSDDIINNEIKNNDFLEILNEDIDIEKFKTLIDNLSDRLKKLGGYQEILFQDFNDEKKELENLITQRNDLHESEKDILKTIDKINNEAKERFLLTFEKIRNNFIMIFKELFQEGDEADLKLIYDIDEEGKINNDPLEAKIEITAKPRGKRPTSIELLSGGEKTLTAIALLFAIYLVKPSPFCVLDEVDAPLDPNNLGRFNNMIRRFSDNTQFIMITHNERTMETVDRLYGVTMQEPGVTTIVETKFKHKVA